MPIDTLKVNVSVRGGPIVLELSNDGGWQRTTREMKAKSKSIECERWYRFYSRKGTRGLYLGNTKTGKDNKSRLSETID
jgi:hypothetical protein